MTSHCRHFIIAVCLSALAQAAKAADTAESLLERARSVLSPLEGELHCRVFIPQ